MITIKELQLDNETALKLIKLIKKEEPEIWKVLKGELTEALNIQNVSNQRELLIAYENYKQFFMPGVFQMPSNKVINDFISNL